MAFSTAHPDLSPAMARASLFFAALLALSTGCLAFTTVPSIRAVGSTQVGMTRLLLFRRVPAHMLGSLSLTQLSFRQWSGNKLERNRRLALLLTTVRLLHAMKGQKLSLDS